MGNKQISGYVQSLAICNESANLCQKVYGWKPAVYDKRVTSKGPFSSLRAITNHHTAAPPGSSDAPSLSTVMYGRPDVSGPLCNILHGFSGSLYAISDGKANHPGKVDKTQYDRCGNAVPYDTPGSDDDNVGAYSGLFGIEIEGTTGSAMSEKQWQSLTCLNAAIMKHFSWTAIDFTVHNHSTLTTRKVDAAMNVPHKGWNSGQKWWPSFTKQHLWADVAKALNVAPPPTGGSTPPPSSGGSGTYTLAFDGGATMSLRYLKRTDPMMKGGDVKSLQGVLNQKGFNAGSEDGAFGDGTAAAVGRAQSAMGLTADKIVGPSTMEKLWER